jgi:hypothetical protein
MRGIDSFNDIGKMYWAQRIRPGEPAKNKQKTLCKSLTHRGFPADCLGLTKRWSLYVASHGNSRVKD